MAKKGQGKLLKELTLSQEKVKTFLKAKFRKHKSYSTVETYGVGLAFFQTFLHDKYPKQKYTLETILPLLSEKKINVYSLFDDFIIYLENSCSPKTIQIYTTAVRSYLKFEKEYEIDVSRFNDRVVLPDINRIGEKVINRITIGNILKAISNRRLRAFVSILSSSGVRSMEAISLRMKDVELSDNEEEPSIIHVRAQYSKMRRTRDVFITWESTQMLNQFLEFKYRNTQDPRDPNDLIFSNKIVKELVIEDREKQKEYEQKLDNIFNGIYQKLSIEFNKILKIVNLGERKDNSLRHKVTFHSFRRYVKTTLSDQVGRDFSEYILGHDGSMGYYGKETNSEIKDGERDKTDAIELYKTAMKQLTFLDVRQFEVTGKNIEKQIQELRQENAILRKRMNKIYEAKNRDYDEASKVVAQTEAIQKLMREENLTHEEALNKMGLHHIPSFMYGGTFYEDRVKVEKNERRMELIRKSNEENKQNMFSYYKHLSPYLLEKEKVALSKEFNENNTECPSCKRKGPYYAITTCGIHHGDEYLTDEETKEYDKAYERQKTLLEKMYAVGLLKIPDA